MAQTDKTEMGDPVKYIRFQLGQETRHVIESIDSATIETSLFSDQYKKALSSLNALFSLEPASSESDSDNTLNKIFSFIGDRGSGKTSCMMSVARLLEQGLDKELTVAYPKVAAHTYRRLGRIDPSFFDESHNVIELFLAGLYNDFCNEVDKRQATSDTKKDAQEREVLELFNQAQKMMLEMTKTSKERFDALDNLQNLSAGVQLWSIIRKLINAYFSYLNCEKGILILPIDDIDLNSRMAAAMMEQIRKFLIQPNIIILFAVKIDQLELSKRLSLVGEYEMLFKHTLLKDANVINDMAEAYLTKLLPHQQRIYMPDGSVYFNQPVAIYPNKQMKPDLYDSVRQMIPELIFKKTRYLFYNTPDKTSYIVPDNLRELRSLVGLLYNMEDYWKENTEQEDHRESNQYNKLLFRKYLYENWVSNNLNVEMQASVQDILNTHDAAQVNAIVLASIKQHFKLNIDANDPSGNTLPSELQLILNASNAHYNIAIGDVLDILDILESSETNIQKLKFIFLLRSFYSMRLYQAYDSETDQNEASGDRVLSKTLLSNLNLSEYEKLVAGYFINSRLSRLIPAGQGTHEPRSERVINFSELLHLINKVVQDQGKNISELRLVEFFLLGISRRYDMRDKYSGMRYRISDAVFYAESLENLSKNVYFDVGALLFNVTHIKKCYKRFAKGDAILNLAQKNKDSLLNRFREIAIKQKADVNTQYDLSNFDEHYWLSTCCFRNAEVIKAFKEHIATFKSPGGGPANVMAKAFKYMGDFTIPFYDKKESGEYQELKFSYLKEFENLLSQFDILEDFMNIFDKDYRPEPESITVYTIIKGANPTHNKKETRLNRLYESCPIIAFYYQKEIHAIFDEYGPHMTREELNTAFNQLDEVLNQYRHQ